MLIVSAVSFLSASKIMNEWYSTRMLLLLKQHFESNVLLIVKGHLVVERIFWCKFGSVYFVSFHKQDLE